MGGVRINGCGVTDHYKTIKSLGIHACPSCKKLAEFTLSEANQKIDVFFIPTFTLKTRYAVMCKKCGNGEFCSVEWAGKLLNMHDTPEILFESQKGGPAASEESVSAGAEPPAPAEKTVSGQRLIGTVLNAKPAEQTEKAAEARLIGTALRASDASGPHEEKTRKPASGAIAFFKCSACGVTQLREGDVCAYCGAPIAD